MSKTISKACIKLVKKWEGCHLTAYNDSVGVPTVGYGLTNADAAITGLVVKLGMRITQKQADELLEKTLKKKYLPLVLKYDKKYNWNQNELDALVSFCYNIGSIDQLTAKGTRTKLEISSKILQYNKAGGKILKGLVNRRNEERLLFITPATKIYSGKLPSSYPERGYYKLGDGYLSNKNLNEQVKRIQKFLNWYSKYALVVDGKYGAKTVAAVKHFQKSEKFADINGKWGKICQGIAKTLRK